MADGLTIILQGEPSDKTRDSSQYQFMEGFGMKPNNSNAAPTNEDEIQFKVDSNGVFYWYDRSVAAWKILNLSSIIAQSINIGNSNLSLNSSRILDGNGFGLLIDNMSSLELDSDNLLLKGGVFTLRTSSNPYFIFRIANENGIDLDFSLLTAQRNLKVPDVSGTIATEAFAQQKANDLATFPLTSNSSGIITDASLVGKKIGLIMGASVPYEEDYQFVKPTNGDTILDAITNDPFVFSENQKYFLTPIVP